MIPKNIKSFCSEDITLIENYDLAYADKNKSWDCHHRLETDLGLTAKELKEQNLYFHRPASELIFLTHEDHTTLHKKGVKLSKEHIENLRISSIGKNTGKKRTPEQRKHQSDISKGSKWMTDGYVQYKVKPEHWGEFIDIGFYFGHISNYGKGHTPWNKCLPKDKHPLYNKRKINGKYVSLDK